MLARADDSLRMKVVLDVGCNAGMMLAAALSDGALWGLGWDGRRSFVTLGGCSTGSATHGSTSSGKISGTSHR